MDLIEWENSKPDSESAKVRHECRQQSHILVTFMSTSTGVGWNERGMGGGNIHRSMGQDRAGLFFKESDFAGNLAGGSKIWCIAGHRSIRNCVKFREFHENRQNMSEIVSKMSKSRVYGCQIWRFSGVPSANLAQKSETYRFPTGKGSKNSKSAK